LLHSHHLEVRPSSPNHNGRTFVTREHQTLSKEKRKFEHAVRSRLPLCLRRPKLIVFALRCAALRRHVRGRTYICRVRLRRTHRSLCVLCVRCSADHGMGWRASPRAHHRRHGVSAVAGLKSKWVGRKVYTRWRVVWPSDPFQSRGNGEGTVMRKSAHGTCLSCGP
jgi:hypothetical protein